MALLILFGFIAGAATALSPCVLPVLPIALSAGATGGRRRPLGIVAGLAVSFTFATVALVYVISALGLPNDFLRKLAIVVLLGFGIVLMIPKLASRLEAWMSQFASRAGVAKGKGDGFWSGTAVGASLGLVYAPCAGPILAGVITVSASQSFSTGRLAVALSYGIGSAVVLYFLMLGGRKVVRPLAQRGVGLQIAMGAVMVVVALAMLGNYDIRFQNHIASSLPSFLVNPTKEPRGHRLGQKRARRHPRRRRPRGRQRSQRRGAGNRRRRQAEDTAGARRGAGIRRQRAVVQHARRQAAHAQRAARAGRPRRLLDLQLHQLHPHLALPEGLGREVPQGRPDDRRRPHARVPLRARSEQRANGDRRKRDPLPGRPGQRTGDVERLRQPVLAGRVLHRRPGHGSATCTSARANTARKSR